MIGIIINADGQPVEYDGIVFGNYSGKYYRCNKSKASNNKRISIHRYIYSKYVDSNIKGFHIHHLDKNPLNNMVCNLIKLTPKQHHEIHKDDEVVMYISKEEWQRRCDESGKQRKIICITTGKEYKSVTDAARETGETSGQIRYSLEGRRKGKWKSNSTLLEWENAC